jgi:arylsulfatase A-like enzyme
VRGLVSAQAQRGRDAVFVLMSDNGMAWGQKGFSLKHTPLATRAPFYVAGPGIAPGETAALASKVDIAPTLAELGGASVPWADGQSFVPLLHGETPADGSPPARSEHLEILPASSGYEGWEALRTPEYRFIRWEDGHRELYDLAADPWQRRNLAERQPDVAAAMEQRLDESLAASAARGAAEREAAGAASPESQSPAPAATPVAMASPAA